MKRNEPSCETQRDMKNLGSLWWCKLTGFSTSKSQKCKVNCWFCNGNFLVDCKEKDQWTCPSCEQYNGFNEDGDYNKPVNVIFEKKSVKTPAFGKTPQQSLAVLCHSCNQNQTLKVRQLASFVPLNERTFDEEISSYHNYLEHIYSLCDSCQGNVKEHLNQQNSQFEEELGRKLHWSHEHSHFLKNNSLQEIRGSRQLVLLPPTLFSLSCVASISLALLQFRLLLEARYRLDGGFFHFIYTCLDSLLYAVPVKNITHLEQSLVYAGVIFCVLGLFTIGKYSLYAVDAFQVFLWLLSLLTWVAVPATFLRNALQGKLFSVTTKLALNVATSLTAVVCVFKGRQPRNISNVRICMKPVVASKSEEEDECSQTDSKLENSGAGNLLNSTSSRKDANVKSGSYRYSSLSSTSSFVGKVENMFVPISSHLRTGSSSPISSHPPSPLKSASKSLGNVRNIQEFPADSENVRQDLEMFTLGLAKRSGSSSSIWSLPSIVTSSPSQSPDLTQNTSQKQSLNRSVLSPSRLGFLSFGSSSPDSGEAAVKPSNVPSSASEWRDSHAREKDKSFRDFHIKCSTHTPRDSPSSSHPMMSNRPSDYSYRMQCDSSTHSTPREAAKEVTKQMSRSASNEEDLAMPDSSSSHGCGIDENGKKGLRRSNRIAMQGKIIKPWPLKKSFSLNTMYDRKNAEFADQKARTESQLYSLDQSKHEEERHSASGFQAYRPTSAFRQTDAVTNSGDNWTSLNRLGTWKYVRRRVPRNIEEFSDEEEDKEEMDCRRSESRNWERMSGYSVHAKNSWSTTMSLLFGLIIGISVTTNAFLLWTLLRKS